MQVLQVQKEQNFHEYIYSTLQHKFMFMWIIGSFKNRHPASI